ncbi:MAG: ParA family protein, partial [Melioribacteraceae bacterium]|nr:ParA family protein [Melioribacteraceae bacterium]
GSESINDCITNTYMPNLDILPSTIDLVGAEVEIVSFPHRETLLKKALEETEYDYEYILIDCPPSLSLLTLNALTASDSVIIPVQCEYFALEGLGQLLNTINVIRKQLNTNLAINGVLLTMYDQRLNLSNQVVDEVKKYFGDKVFDTIIHRNVRISEAPSHAKPVILYDAISTGARNYISLASEVINRSNHNLSGKENE